MQSKFRFSLDGKDATARQFAEIRRQLLELPASVGRSVSRLSKRVDSAENTLTSLTSEQSLSSDEGDDAIVVPAHGGTGVRNAYDNLFSLTPLKPVCCFPDGRLGTDCSSAYSVTNVRDADEFVAVEAFRQVKWRVYAYKDDLNLKGDDAQPVVGLLAEELDDAGLGFFCLYDDVGVPVGVDYPKLSVAVLRLVQKSMDEVDELKATVGRLSAEVDRMRETYVKDSTVGE